MFVITSNILALSSQSPLGSASSASDTYGPGRGAELLQDRAAGIQLLLLRQGLSKS